MLLLHTSSIFSSHEVTGTHIRVFTVSNESSKHKCFY